VRVALFGFYQDLVDIVDWSLYAVLLCYFLSFYHNDDANDPIGYRHVE
jgi:hypothetical protein